MRHRRPGGRGRDRARARGWGRGRPTPSPAWARWVTLAFAATVVATTVVSWEAGGPPAADPAVDRAGASADAAVRFVAAWERSRRATFVREGVVERRSADGSNRLRAEDLLAQDPPRRVHRQFGGVEGRVGDRILLCPAGPDDEPAPRCAAGPPSGRTYDQAVEDETRAVRAQVVGTAAPYRVRDAGSGCFVLDLVRVAPTAGFGARARFCFDAATGAPTASTVRHPAGVVEILTVERLDPVPNPDDLRP